MKKHLLSGILVAFIAFGAFSLQHTALAQTDPLGLEYGAATGLGSADIRFTIARIITVVLGILGILLVCLILYAGFLWMTAAGNTEEVDKAKKIISGAVVGLIIIMSAYSLTRFIVNNLYKATTGYTYQ